MSYINYIGNISGLMNGYKPTYSNNSKKQKRCKGCTSYKDMYCLSKQKSITSVLEATRCEAFKKIDFKITL